MTAATPATGSSRPEGPPGNSHPAQPAIAAAAPATGSSMPDAPSGYVLPIWGLVAAAAPATGSTMQDGLSQASSSTCPDGPVGFDADHGYCSSGSTPAVAEAAGVSGPADPSYAESPFVQSSPSQSSVLLEGQAGEAALASNINMNTALQPELTKSVAPASTHSSASAAIAGATSAAPCQVGSSPMQPHALSPSVHVEDGPPASDPDVDMAQTSDQELLTIPSLGSSASARNPGSSSAAAPSQVRTDSTLSSIGSDEGSAAQRLKPCLPTSWWARLQNKPV